MSAMDTTSAPVGNLPNEDKISICTFLTAVMIVGCRLWKLLITLSWFRVWEGPFRIAGCHWVGKVLDKSGSGPAQNSDGSM